jgi:DNA polymerase-4
MPIAEAYRRCPELLRVRPRVAHYKAVSARIFAIFREFTPVVEGLSLDEAFLDVTASLKIFGSGKDIAVAIKKKVRERTALTASVGVAGNKLVAKIASDLEKPDGLVVVSAANCRAILDPLPASVIPGVGPKTLARLRAARVLTLHDLRQASDATLGPIFGRYAQRMRDRAAGRDERPVQSARIDKSISAEQTYDRDLDDPADMERELFRLADRTARRLQKASLVAATVQVKIRSADFSTCTRQMSLQPAGNAAQADLFAGSGTADPEPMDSTINQIRDRFGDGALGRARSLDPRPGRWDKVDRE